MESKGISIILYPRSYNKRGHHSLHSVQGLTPDGREVNVKLRLDEKHLGQDYAPSIAEFAREDRKATRACIASPDNGPDCREGILLFTQAIPDSKSNSPQDTYIAKWASVLAEDSESPDPYFGFARMQISKNSSAVVKLRAKLKEAVERGDSQADIMALESRLQDTRNYSYPAIFYYPELGTYRRDDDKEEVFRLIAESVSRHSKGNLLGGCLLRWSDSKQRVDPQSYRELFPRFDGNKNAFETPTIFAQRVLRELGDRLLRKEGGSVEIIPLIRINTGQATSAHYGKQNRYKAIERLYYDVEGLPLLCRASAKVTHYEHNGRTYLSRLYALTEPLGDPRRLSFDGQFNKLFIGEKQKLWFSPDQKGEASEVPAGLSAYREGTNLSLDFFFSKEKYLAAYSDHPSNNDNEGQTLYSPTENDSSNEHDVEIEGVKVNERVQDSTELEGSGVDELMVGADLLGGDSRKDRLADGDGDESTSEERSDYADAMIPGTTDIKDDESVDHKNDFEEMESMQDDSVTDQDQVDQEKSGNWLDGLDDHELDIPVVPEISEAEDEFFKELPVEQSSSDAKEPTVDEDKSTGLEDDNLENNIEENHVSEEKVEPSRNHFKDKNDEELNDSNKDEDEEEGGLAAFLNI